MSVRKDQAILLTLGMLVGALVATVVIAWVRMTPVESDGPVCTAATEDSTIVDCDYRDGGWYQEEG